MTNGLRTEHEWAPPKRPVGKRFTVVEIDSLKAGPRPYRLSGGDGLVIEVSPTGSKLWRFRYRSGGGKETVMSLGPYPEVTLATAAQRVRILRSQLHNGTDPGTERADDKASESNTFAALAARWLEKTTPTRTERANLKISRGLARHVFPKLGRLPFRDITAQRALPVFEAMAEAGLIHTAKVLLSACNAIADYAATRGVGSGETFRPIGKQLPSERIRHHPALVDSRLFAGLLRAIESDTGGLLVREALRFLALTFVRPGELRNMQWSGVKWDLREWHLVSTDKKERRDHIVPLCSQSIALLQRIRELELAGPLVFGARGGTRPLSDATLTVALDRLGFRGVHAAHGFRASARTILDEHLRFPVDIIEHQLAHLVRGPLGDTYARTTKIEDRHVMMQAWGHYLERIAVPNADANAIAREMVTTRRAAGSLL